MDGLWIIDPIYKWMITKGTPILGNAQITMERNKEDKVFERENTFFYTWTVGFEASKN